jgi:hypothetical protein
MLKAPAACAEVPPSAARSRMKLAADRGNKAVVAAGASSVMPYKTGPGFQGHRGASRSRRERDPPIILTTKQPVATWW